MVTFSSFSISVTLLVFACSFALCEDNVRVLNTSLEVRPARSLEEDHCKRWCRSTKHLSTAWSIKCGWKNCKSCDECGTGNTHLIPSLEKNTEVYQLLPWWTFSVFADLHSFGHFPFLTAENAKPLAEERSRILTSIVRNHEGGSVALTVGDSVSFGRLTNQLITQKIEKMVLETYGESNEQISTQEAIYMASKNAHTKAREIFHQSGYDLVLPTIGDHEIGGNNGFRIGAQKSKINTISSYRRGFFDAYMKKQGFQNEDKVEEVLLYHTDINGVPGTPIGTLFEGTSYAVQVNNALFITLDVFKPVGDQIENYIDREKGFGGEGAITGDVDSDHLEWFVRILAAGNEEPSIQHIFVQSHLPILQPVRKENSSGQFLDGAQESELWKAMEEGGVDVYFAGDVHRNTATKSKKSNLIQVVTMSNFLLSFLRVNVTDTSIEMVTFGTNIDNDQYDSGSFHETGKLIIAKEKGGGEVLIDSSGDLELMDLQQPLIFFDFDELRPLSPWQILDIKSTTVDNVECVEVIENRGVYGENYDALISNVSLVSGRSGGGLSGQFDHNSRLAIHRMGPHSAGGIISIALWFKTANHEEDMILMSYVNRFSEKYGPPNRKNDFILTLDTGVPTYYFHPELPFRALGLPSLADGEWHHLALIMPKKSCLMSEFQLYVDGSIIDTVFVGDKNQGEKHVFFTTSGQMNFAGFGYAGIKMRDGFPTKGPFIGELDDIGIWARPLSGFDVQQIKEAGVGRL